MERRERFLRQRDILVPDDLEGLDIDVVGGGSLGGAIVLSLLKMGCGIRNEIRVWDDDFCRRHNLANQWFRESHAALGQSKVTALEEMAAWVCDREIVPRAVRLTGGEEERLGPVVVLAVDSLEERRALWRRLRRREDLELLLDARMGAEVAEVYAVVLDGEESSAPYDRSLEGEPFDEPCTRRSVLYTALGGAAFVGSLLRAYARGEPFPRRVTFDFRNFLLETAPLPDLGTGVEARA